MSTAFESAVRGNMSQTRSWFRHLHQNPELSFNEFLTTNFITEILRTLPNIEIWPVSPTGVIGILRGKQEGPSIGLRADIDALQLVEKTAIDYKSRNRGVMHACGHDVNTANLLATAKILNDYVNQIKGNVYFIFQPAEEIHPGGAIGIVESGILNDVDYIYGQHLIPAIPTGEVGIKKGTVFLASDVVNITIHGKGGHAAVPNLAIDPVVVAAEVILALQTIVSRKTHPYYSPIISTTMVNTPIGADNVIPESIAITASVRNQDVDVRQDVVQWIKRMVDGIASAHGATATVDYIYGYGPVVNDEVPNQVARTAAQSFLPDAKVLELDDPIQAGEDFGSYGKVAEIAYYLIGNGNPEKHTDVSPHSPMYKADETAMYYGIMMHLSVIEEMLIK